jgi:NADH-quinone oxidoreductase subunit H
MEVLKTLLYLFVYPGLLFLFLYSTFCEWVDRKVYARLQNRLGPLYTGRQGILQPIADFLKLMAKEDILPTRADKLMFTLLPIVILAVVCTAAMYLPLWHYSASSPSFISFPGDLIVVVFLLTLPTLIFFLAGWYSSGFFSAVGGTRVITMLFGYEVPLYLAVLGSAMLAGSWRLVDISLFYQAHPLLLLPNILGFLVALIALQAKLERVPFDLPHAETEIVGGTFTEYSGRKLAFIHLAIDIEMVVGAGLIAAVFLGGFSNNLLGGFFLFILKTLLVVILLSIIRAMFARIRIDQLIHFAWWYLAPLAVVHILIIIVIKGIFL